MRLLPFILSRSTPEKVSSPDSELPKETLGDKAADTVRNGMGSWPFVFIFLLMMVMWGVMNSIVLKKHAFDPYPYILLNLMLSTLAGLQGAILLIAAKRADAIMDIVIQHIKRTVDKIDKNDESIDRQLREIKKLLKGNK